MSSTNGKATTLPATTNKAPVDLTTLAADTPLPADPNHPVYKHHMPDELPLKYDPLRFAVLESQVRTLTQQVQLLMQERQIQKGKSHG